MAAAPGVRIALLRGINVGHAKRVPMAALRELFTGLGYTSVTTLLNSGNVVFSGPRDSGAKSESRIEGAFTARFGFSSRITVITAAELTAAIEENPIREIPDPARFLVAFLKTADHRQHLLPLLKENWGPEELGLGSRSAYLSLPEGILVSRLNTAVCKALGDAMTARNWATVLKLRTQADSIGS